MIFFLFLSIMERIRKGSDLPKKKWGSPSIQQKYKKAVKRAVKKAAVSQWYKVAHN